MRLPRMPNSFMKSRAQTMQFLGINFTDNYQDGEMADSKNLSTLNYPTLSQRKGRSEVTGYDEVTDMYEWDGDLIIVSNNTLYIDGEPVATVNDEKKQFAVVNTRLIVFPDKISIDLRNNEFKSMEATVSSNGTAESVVFTSNSLTMTLESKIKNDARYGFRATSGGGTFSPYFFTYGTDMTEVRACWDESTATWDFEALELLKKTWAMSPNAMSTLNCEAFGEVGEIFIPEISNLAYKPVSGTANSASTITPPDTTKYNNLGYVAVIDDMTASDDDGPWMGTNNTYNVTYVFDVYDVTGNAVDFSSVFDVGDMIDITGTRYGLLDTTYNGDDTTTSSKLKIVGITDTTADDDNTLTFAADTFSIPYAAGTLGATQIAGYYYFRVKQSANSSSYYYYKFTTDKRILSGQVIVIYGVNETENIHIWDIEKHKDVATYVGTRSTSAPGGSYTNLGTLALYDTSTQIVSVNRSIPDLDYICERDNRLWGVSNSDKTIYCSALGIPWAFYDYSGLDTDSYAVAVGSSGDFTGIVNYGGVLCFKENKVHKMLGSYPSDFYMNTYEVAGIQDGAYASAKIISEILYYRSPLGVVAFTGYQPTNISPNLALENTIGGVAGTNGQEYYLCVQAKDLSKHILYKFDLQRKLWTKEEEVDIECMTNIGNDLYMSIHTTQEVEVSGQTQTVDVYTAYLTGQDNDEVIEWYAQFVPYTETSAGGFRKAGYTRIVLRFDMEQDAVFTIKVRYDNGLWETAWTQVATNKLVHTVPLRIKRCDKFEIKLEGTGRTKIRSMQREFIQGGWYDNGWH